MRIIDLKAVNQRILFDKFKQDIREILNCRKIFQKVKNVILDLCVCVFQLNMLMRLQESAGFANADKQ